jgi:putative FmdB family regulatory protein
MPLYEYRCPSCEHRFEILQRMGETASGLRCPDCGRGGVERELSTFASSGLDGAACAPTRGFT